MAHVFSLDVDIPFVYKIVADANSEQFEVNWMDFLEPAALHRDTYENDSEKHLRGPLTELATLHFRAKNGISVLPAAVKKATDAVNTGMDAVNGGNGKFAIEGKEHVEKMGLVMCMPKPQTISRMIEQYLKTVRRIVPESRIPEVLQHVDSEKDLKNKIIDCSGAK